MLPTASPLDSPIFPTPDSWFSGSSSGNHSLSPDPDSPSENSQTILDCSLLLPSHGVEDAFRETGITPEEVLSATYNRKHHQLWPMMENHRCAAAILDKFGLSAERPASRVKFKGGLELTTDKVVRHLRWATRTFTRKSTSYRTARLLATYSWKGSPPAVNPLSDEGKTLLDLYHLWKGVVAMFAVGGFSNQPCAPRSDALANETERSAALLSQNQLYNGLNALLPHLQPPPT